MAQDVLTTVTNAEEVWEMYHLPLLTQGGSLDKSACVHVATQG